MNLPPMSESLGVWLATDTYDGYGDAKTISATTLLKSTRQIVLSRRVDAEIATPNINSLIASRIGTAIHAAIESAWVSGTLPKALEALGLPSRRYVVNPENPSPEGKVDVYVERRFSREIDGWTVTGQADIIIAGQLHDVKTTKSFNVENKLSYNSWKMQGSIYRWLKPEVIKDDSVIIECIVLDWSAAGAASSPNYPQQQWCSIQLELMPLEQTELFIRAKLADIKTYLDSDEKLIPECTDEDLWRDPPRFAYYANPAAAGRSTKNFDTLAEANQYLASKGKGRVDVRLGKVKACHYCPAASICTQRLRYLDEQL